MNFYWSEEFSSLLKKDNERVGKEWIYLMDAYPELPDEEVFKLIDRQSLRFKKLFERFECDS